MLYQFSPYHATVVLHDWEVFIERDWLLLHLDND